ncbi:MAG: hypothetical protein ACK4GN_15750 [Runella sp.]
MQHYLSLLLQLRKKIEQRYHLTRAAAIVLLLACAGGPSDLNEFTSYFMPEIANVSTGDTRYHFTQQFLYLDDYADSVKIDRQVNAQAWAQYAGVSEQGAYDYFYGEKNSVALPNRLMIKGKSEAVTYLKLAKDIEKAYQPAVFSWEESTKDSTALVEAFEKVKTLAQSTTDPFLKERYGFQAVKLAMILEQPQTCLTLYDQLIKPLPTKTFISDWAASRRAGALMALGQTDRAIYEFAQVFDRCPSRRREADLSLRVKGIRFQEKALDYCQNDAEKAAVYALCAIQPLEDGLPMLKKIVALNPQNPLIELITAREINKNEFYMNGPTPYVEDTVAFQNRGKATQRYFEELADFTTECAENKNLQHPAFWWTAASYCQYALKNYDKASDYLTKAKAAPTENITLKLQQDVQQMLLLIANQESITPAFENQAMGLLQRFAMSDNFRVVNAFTRSCGLLANMYEGLTKEPSGGLMSGCSNKKQEAASGINIAKAYLLKNAASWQSKPSNPEGYTTIVGTHLDRDVLEDETSVEDLAQVIEYVKQSNKSEFDQKLIQLSGITADHLYIVLGRKFLLQHQYANAAEHFEQVKPDIWQESPFSDYLTANPFYIKPDNGQNPNESFTPASFARRMVDLEKKANEGDAEAAYLLGCGAYNMGYFGNSWLCSKRYRSSSEYEYMYPPRDLSTDDYYTAQKALTYFEKVLEKSKNQELSAKASFGASLCAANAFWVFRAAEGREIGYDEEAQQKFMARMSKEQRKRLAPYFEKLKKQFSSTQYAQEVLRECATYRAYMGE